MKKIIFLDLDGTLWTFEKIPSSALKAIELARKNEHKIYINTGRTRCEIPQFLLDMNLDGYCFGAGSEIIIDNKQVLFEPLKKRDTQFIQHIAKDSGFSLEGSKMTFTNEKTEKECCNLIRITVWEIVSYLFQIFQQLPTMITIKS